jgi:ATP-dependent Clp protease ATP-binding subunit ClpX
MTAPEWDGILASYRRSLRDSRKYNARTCSRHVATIKDLRAFVARQYQVEDIGSFVASHLKSYLSNGERFGSRSAVLSQKTSVLRCFFAFARAEGIIQDDPSWELAASKRNGRQANPVPKTTPDDAKEVIVESERASRLLSAHAIKAYLDTKVVGQELAKVQISILLSMHLSWFRNQERSRRSPNAVIIGPTGVGKTHTIRVAAEFLKVPFVHVDTTSLVPSGIVGLQIEDVLADVVREAGDILKRENRAEKKDADLELARRGIVFFDEFDKIRYKQNGAGDSHADTMSVQRRLLKLADGAVLSVGVRGHQSQVPRNIDTSGMLILAGGAFVGVDDKGVRSLRSADLARDLASCNPNLVVSEDIVHYGFMPELVARFPVLIEYCQLGADDLLRILDMAEVSPLQVWVDHFAQFGKELLVTEEAKRFAIKRTLALGMGARGLQQVLFPALAGLAYGIEESPVTRYTVDVTQLRGAPPLARRA